MGGRFLRLGGGFGFAGSFLGCAAHDLLDAYREGAPGSETLETC
jgi:hypothetical protein